MGTVLLAQERFGPVRTRLTLAGFLLAMSASLALFVFLDNQIIVYSQSLGIVIDTIALLAAALFFDFIHASVSTRDRAMWPYAVVIAYLFITGVNGGRLIGPTEFAPIVFANIAFSILALATYLRSRRSLPPGWTRRPEHKRLPVLLAGMGVFHLAQVLRLFAPSEPFLFDLVPFVGAIGLLAFAVYGLIGSQTLRTLATVRRHGAAGENLGAMIDKLMDRERIYLDPDLSLQKAASSVGASPAQLSSYLNTERGVTFRSYVNDLRIEEAKRLLRSPDEACTSVEAVAMMSGFRSRSSFYTAFQSRLSKSPQEYRSEG